MFVETTYIRITILSESSEDSLEISSLVNADLCWKVGESWTEQVADHTDVDASLVRTGQGGRSKVKSSHKQLQRQYITGSIRIRYILQSWSFTLCKQIIIYGL